MKILNGSREAFKLAQWRVSAAVASPWRPWRRNLQPVPKREYHVEGCATCTRIGPGGFGPPHDAGANCQSGKRKHCTCDWCF